MRTVYTDIEYGAGVRMLSAGIVDATKFACKIRDIFESWAGTHDENGAEVASPDLQPEKPMSDPESSPPRNASLVFNPSFPFSRPPRRALPTIKPKMARLPTSP